MELAKKMEADATKRKNPMVSSGDRSAKSNYSYTQVHVTDHRINLTLYDLSNIINGDIQKIIDELQLAEKLKENSDIL